MRVCRAPVYAASVDSLSLRSSSRVADRRLLALRPATQGSDLHF